MCECDCHKNSESVTINVNLTSALINAAESVATESVPKLRKMLREGVGRKR